MARTTIDNETTTSTNHSLTERLDIEHDINGSSTERYVTEGPQDKDLRRAIGSSLAALLGDVPRNWGEAHDEDDQVASSLGIQQPEHHRRHAAKRQVRTSTSLSRRRRPDPGEDTTAELQRHGSGTSLPVHVASCGTSEDSSSMEMERRWTRRRASSRLIVREKTRLVAESTTSMAPRCNRSHSSDPSRAQAAVISIDVAERLRAVRDVDRARGRITPLISATTGAGRRGGSPSPPSPPVAPYSSAAPPMAIAPHAASTPRQVTLRPMGPGSRHGPQ